MKQALYGGAKTLLAESEQAYYEAEIVLFGFFAELHNQCYQAQEDLVIDKYYLRR